MIKEVTKMVAINFAEWLQANEWVKRTLTHPSNIGKYWSHKHCEYKTIEELYELFLNDERNRLSIKTNKQ